MTTTFITLGTAVQEVDVDLMTPISREHFDSRLATGEVRLFSGELDRIDRPAVNGYGAPTYWFVAKGVSHPAEDRWSTLCTRTKVGTVIDGVLSA